MAAGVAAVGSLQAELGGLPARTSAVEAVARFDNPTEACAEHGMNSELFSQVCLSDQKNCLSEKSVLLLNDALTKVLLSPAF